MAGGPRVLCAPDAFKGTASATDLADAMAAGARRAGWAADRCPLSDGGEGFAEVLGVLGGELRTTPVTGPLGGTVTARWRFAASAAGPIAVIECAAASGLALVGGAEGNDPVAATSRGTGELVVAAVAAGATRILVGAGGSATTDGGAGAVAAIEEAGGLGGAAVEVACDVRTGFLDAARVFGPQKGAGPVQVAELQRRLACLARRYRERYGVDVTTMPGAGAAGGLAGGLAALGARLEPGFELVAAAVGFGSRLAAVDLVVTGEGRFDATSWQGKVTGEVVRLARRRGVPALIVAGSVAPGTPRRGARVVDLVARCGLDAARGEPGRCVADAVTAHLTNAR